jgi:uncharacterized Tic20 family protein
MIQTIDATEREARNWAVAAHLSSLVAVAGLPFGHIVGPLVVYLFNGDKRPFATEHAKAALNFQITISIGMVVLLFVGLFAYFGAIFNAVTKTPEGTLPVAAIALLFGVFAIFFIGAIWSLVLIIMGAVAAGHGRPYRYPFAIDFIK